MLGRLVIAALWKSGQGSALRGSSGNRKAGLAWRPRGRRSEALKQTFSSIQALRGLAAALVVIAHIIEHPLHGAPNAVLLTGRFGVEIFFVISGFVMTHVAGDGPFAPRDFAIRRLLRIVPLYWACSILVFAVALAAPNVFKTTVADFKHLAASLFFIPDPDPVNQTDWRPLYKLGWTLNYEMFFYAALMVLFWCRSSRERSVILTLALGSLVVLSFVIPPKESMLAFYLNIALLPFLVGVWMAEFAAVFQRVPRWGVAGLLAAAVLSVIALYRVDFEDLRALGGHAIMTAAATFIVAAGLACEQKFPRRGFARMVGDSSYSLYLTHMFVVGAAWAVIDRLPVPGAVRWAGGFLIAGACLLMAYHSFRWVETPFNRLAQRLTGRTARARQAGPAIAQ
jgi:peptidoglycan/LPS O-acetylase OafA/YrhL